MKKLNKKAFTMIELLATITILGLLSMVAIPSVKYLIQKGKDNYYITQKNNIELAAKEYIKDNPQLLPGEIGGSREIKLEDLIKNKYISDVKDSNDNNCDYQKTKVTVKRTGKAKYAYSTYLECPGYKDSEKETTQTEGNANISVEAIKKTEDTDASVTDFKIKITIKPSNNLTKIKYYKYRIIRNGEIVGDKVSRGTVLEEREYETTKKGDVIKQVDLTDYVKDEKQTVLQIEVTAITSNNSKTIKSFNVSAKDTQPPKCPLENPDVDVLPPKNGIISYIDKSTGDVLISTRNEWSKEPQTLTFYCHDKDDTGANSQCKNDHYTITLKKDTDAISKTVRMEDVFGNKSHSCQIPDTLIRIDTTKPTVNVKLKKLAYTDSEPSTIETSDYNEEWHNGKVFTQVEASDDPPSGAAYEEMAVSGLKTDYASYTTSGKEKPNEKDKVGKTKMISAEGTSTIKYKVCDIAGNCRTSKEYDIKLDRTAPKCDTGYQAPTNYDGSWTKSAVTLKGTCSEINEDSSGCKANTITGSTIDYEVNDSFSPGTVEDNVGLKTACPTKPVKIDRTAPKVVVSFFVKNSAGDPTDRSGASSTKYTPDTWLNKRVFTDSVDSTDNSNAELQHYVTVEKGSAATTCTDLNHSYRNINAEGISTIHYKVCDQAGNCTTSPSYKVKLDRSAPSIDSITITSTEIDGTNFNKTPKGTVRVTGSDVGSAGIKKTEVSGMCSGSGTTSPLSANCSVNWNQNGTITAKITDNAGNETTQNTFTIYGSDGRKISDNNTIYKTDSVTVGQCKYYGYTLGTSIFPPYIVTNGISYSNLSFCGATKDVNGKSSGYPMYYLEGNDIYNCVNTKGDAHITQSTSGSNKISIGGNPGKHKNQQRHTCGTTSCYPSCP